MQPPWDDTFAPAWASYIDGTTPVGATLRDRDGRRVATGLNRRYSSQPVAGQLSGSRLAHAELNALAGVHPTSDVRDHTLYTILEPCSLCVGASIQAGVGKVVYATPDAYGGAASMRLDNRQVRLRRPDLVAEPDLEWRDLGALLMLVFAIGGPPVLQHRARLSRHPAEGGRARREPPHPSRAPGRCRRERTLA